MGGVAFRRGKGELRLALADMDGDSGGLVGQLAQDFGVLRAGLGVGGAFVAQGQPGSHDCQP